MNKRSIINNAKRWAVPISFLFLFFLAARFTGCDLAAFWKRRSHLTDLVADMIPPDFSYIRKILLPLFYTIQMSVTGTVLGAFFAIAAAPFAAGKPEISCSSTQSSPDSHPGSPLFSGTDSGADRHIFVRAWNLCRYFCNYLVYLCHYDKADL